MNTYEETMKDVASITRSVMHEFPYYGYFMTTLKKVVITEEDEKLYEQIKTAAVSKSQHRIGYTMFINADFWWTLEKKQKIELLLHELEHIVYFHPTLSLSFKEKELFNISADILINQNKHELLKINNNMSIEDYTKFCKENAEAIRKGQITTPFRGCSLEDYGFDPATESGKGTRYYYNRLLEMQNDENDQSQGAQNLRAMVGAMKAGAPVEGSHDSWDSMGQMTPEEAELLDNNTKDVLKRIHDDNPKLAGNLPGHLRDFIEDMIKPRPPVANWKSALRQFTAKSIKYNIKSSRRKLNKRIEEYSSNKMKPKITIFAGLDTSGSMSNDDIAMAFSEIDQIRRSGVTVIVGECDAALNEKEDVYEFTGKYPKSRKGLSGGGGKICATLCRNT